MERKVGEVFTYNGKTYEVVKGSKCENCDIKGRCVSTSSIFGLCFRGYRSDKTSVIFKEINNMENNQLTINIPKGMEIDLENSNLAKGIVKFKKKAITYDDILQVIDSVNVRISTYCIDKILAISQLINIAKYYNGDWKPNWESLAPKFSISFNPNRCEYVIYNDYSRVSGNVLFKRSEDAQAVINNPNFRDILDAIYKN